MIAERASGLLSLTHTEDMDMVETVVGACALSLKRSKKKGKG